MTTIDIDESLRAQSKLLLRKLKDKQGKLQNIVKSASNDQSKDFSETEVKTQLDTHLSSEIGHNSRHCRQNLKKLSKGSKEEKGELNHTKHDNKENLAENHQKQSFGSKDVEMEDLKDNRDNEDVTDFSQTEEKVIGHSGTVKKSLLMSDTEAETTCKFTATPNTVRRRKIIDRNVRVGNQNLDESTLLRECEEDFPRLNFSYSGVDDTDLQFLESRFGGAARSPEATSVKETDDGKYKDKLENAGNSRRYAKFIRETSKPKSILLSTNQKQNKSNSKVSFHSPNSSGISGKTYLMDSTLKDNQKMLGYDWIAALIENDPNAVNQSETFFEDLREFRRVNREECVNQLYMEGPADLWEHPEREPSPVARALEETRQAETEVKPYQVNDRLFTEPIKRSLFADYEVEDKKQKQKEKDPTYEEPRFVRVSIPRSTLLSPHRVKPHRRKSFDPTDTMALSEHCLKGWDTSSVSMMPAASNIGLRDATTGIKSTMKTTLHDAEKLAANFPYHWDPSEQKISRPAPKLSVRPESAYMDVSRPYSRQNESSLFNSTKGLKQATDDLLNSTYSLMYEMQRLKGERNVDPIRIN